MSVRIILLSILLAAAGSAFCQPAPAAPAWPAPPDRARIRHLQTISSFEGFDENKGFFARIVRFFTGGEREKQWLVQPVGIAAARTGRLFVADPGANGVHVIDLPARKYEFLGGTKTAGFVSPVGVALAVDGTVYVSDSKRGEVDAFDSDLKFQFAITGHLQRPTGLAVAHGRLYVADAGRQAVVIFDLKGSYVTEFGKRGAGAGEFNFPVSVAGGSDSLFVVDALNYRVQEFDSTGRFISTFGTQGNVAGRFASPKSIAFDSDRNLYVTDALMDNVQIFDPSGSLLLIVGRSGSRDGEFSSPGGIAIGSDNRIYVVETLNRRIQVLEYLP
jgi:DNA-binding beta-propeller fold protein YncE